jgi:hypothetical protein
MSAKVYSIGGRLHHGREVPQVLPYVGGATTTSHRWAFHNFLQRRMLGMHLVLSCICCLHARRGRVLRGVIASPAPVVMLSAVILVQDERGDLARVSCTVVSCRGVVP